MKNIKHAEVVYNQPTRYFGVICLGDDKKVLLQEVFALSSGRRLSTYLNSIIVTDEIFPFIKETHVMQLGLVR